MNRLIGWVEQFKSSSNVESRRKVSEKLCFIYDELIDTYYGSSAKEQAGYAILS